MATRGTQTGAYSKSGPVLDSFTLALTGASLLGCRSLSRQPSYGSVKRRISGLFGFRVVLLWRMVLYGPAPQVLHVGQDADQQLV